MDMVDMDMVDIYNRGIIQYNKNKDVSEIPRMLKKLGVNSNISSRFRSHFNNLNQSDLKRIDEKIFKLATDFKNQLEKNKDQINEFSIAIKNNDMTKIKDFLLHFAKNNLTEIRVENSFNLYLNQKEIKELRENLPELTSDLIQKGVLEFNKLSQNFGITVGLSSQSLSASVNIRKFVSTLTDNQNKRIKSMKVGDIPVSSIIGVLNRNNIVNLKIDKEIIDGFRSNSLSRQINATNQSLGLNINPEKDIKDAANLLISSLCKQRELTQSSQEENLGNSSVLFRKSPTASYGSLSAYNVNMEYNYALLNGAGISTNISGTVIRSNLSKEINIKKGFNVYSGFSFGAAIVDVNASFYIADYNKEIISRKGMVIPIVSSEVGFKTDLGKDITFTGGISFLPGTDVSFENDKFKFKPTIQSSIQTSISIKI